MKRLIVFYSLCLFSCGRWEKLSLQGTDRYVATKDYIALDDAQKPPYLYYNGWFRLGEIYRIRWDDRSIVATKYPQESAYHEYYVIYARDSILTGSGSDILLGPLTERQRDPGAFDRPLKNERDRFQLMYITSRPT